MDVVLRGATVALAFSAACVILSRAGVHRVAVLGALAVAGIGVFMISSAPGIHLALGPAAFFFDAWCLATPMVIWLLARSLFMDAIEVSPALLAAMGATVLLTLAGDYGRFHLGPLAGHPGAAEALLLAGRAVALGLLFMSCAMALLHWRVDLVEQRRRARAVFVAVVGTAFVVLAASEFVFGSRGAPHDWRLAGHSILLAGSFAILQAAASGVFAELYVTPSGHKPAATLSVVRSDEMESQLAQRVLAEMAGRKLWRRDGMGIADFARELGTQEYRLRRAINHRLGFRNFNDFLHHYRLREASGRLRDPAELHLPVLTIALDCGYGSIGPFNRAFKSRFGVTPTQYRNLSPIQAETHAALRL